MRDLSDIEVGIWFNIYSIHCKANLFIYSNIREEEEEEEDSLFKQRANGALKQRLKYIVKSDGD